MKTNNKTPLALSVGAVLMTSYLPTTAQADQTQTTELNPFAMTELSSGYMQLAEADVDVEQAVEEGAKKMDGACGEGKCGAGMMEESGKAVPEGNCAGNKSEKKDKASEGKCGEGKCGGNMQ